MKLISRFRPRLLAIGIAAWAIIWSICVLIWRMSPDFSAAIGWLVFSCTVVLVAGWGVSIQKAARREVSPESDASPDANPAKRQTSGWSIRGAWFATVAYLPCWQWLLFASEQADFLGLRASLASAGTAGFFLIGLSWLVWGLEKATRSRFVATTAATHTPPTTATSSTTIETRPAPTRHARVWSPFDLRAWYLGRRSPRLRQSLYAFIAYSLAFFLAATLLSRLGGCSEIYEMPAGGGQQQTIAQMVKIQKVIKKKFVINPYSAIIFNPPPIDDVKLQLVETTQHLYTVGYGEGAGAGFAGGTSRGKVRFIRLEYAGGDWDQDFGVGADLNMLVEYGARTGHKTLDRTESRTIAQLANFPVGKSPPMVYLTGQRDISLSKSEIATLRAYLVDKHGMLFGDNGGSAHFHNQFFAMMRQALPNIEPVRVPLDDVIHRVPFQIPFLPYVAPHGGKDAWGWRLDGRWVAYYHPGDIGDAWTDDHSGVPPEIYEYCYQLGTNVIFYAHLEYNKWLDARSKGNSAGPSDE